MTDWGLAFEVLCYGLALVGCGYILGRDKGVKIGAGKTIDTLCDNGYLRFVKKANGDIEILKLNESEA